MSEKKKKKPEKKKSIKGAAPTFKNNKLMTNNRRMMANTSNESNHCIVKTEHKPQDAFQFGKFSIEKRLLYFSFFFMLFFPLSISLICFFFIFATFRLIFSPGLFPALSIIKFLGVSRRMNEQPIDRPYVCNVRSGISVNTTQKNPK